MKRGLCCLSAVLLCAATLAVADTPAERGSAAATPAVKAKVMPRSFSVAPANGPEDMGTAAALQGVSPQARAPRGYLAPMVSGVRAPQCDPPLCEGETVAEGEPTCADGYVDTYNSGCNDDAGLFPFTDIDCNTTVCGTGGNYIAEDDVETRDTDWYRNDSTGNPLYANGVQYTWTVRADFPVLIFFIQSGDCAAEDYVILQSTTADPCETAELTACVPAGEYWFLVMTQDFTGTPCGAEYEATLTCEPCDAAEPPTCDEDLTLHGQRPYGELELDASFFAASSLFGDYMEPGIKRFENFQGLDTAVDAVSVFGVLGLVDEFGQLRPCDLAAEDINFDVEFYRTDPATNRPDLAFGPVCDYDAASLTVEKIDTDNTFTLSGSEFTLWQFRITLPSPCGGLTDGWLAIQNEDVCSFWWISSPEGGTVHVLLDEETGRTEDIDGDLAYCLEGDTSVQLIGACCDAVNWSPVRCFNRDIDECLELGMTFFPDEMCAAIDCATIYPLGACCVDGFCLDDFTEPTCEIVEGGVWLEGESCFSTPEPDCDISGECPVTCSGIWGMDMTQGSGTLFPSYKASADIAGVGGLEYYSVSQDITKVGWWGVDSPGSAGPDCDFEDLLDPTPFWVTFFPGGAPPGGQPTLTSPTSFAVEAAGCLTGFGFTGSGYGSLKYWAAPLSHTQRSGWIAVQSDSGQLGTSCILWLWDGSGGDEDGFCGFMNSSGFQSVTTDVAICLYGGVTLGACCDHLTGTCTAGVAEFDCQGARYTFLADGICAELDCEALPGACCRPDGTCDDVLFSECEEAEYFLGVGTECFEDCCVPQCPPEGTPEGEPVCGFGYTDTFNPGCIADPPVFSSLAVGDVICGETGIYEFDDPNAGIVGRRDTDWYQFTLAQTSYVEWTLIGDFESDLFIGEGSCDGFVLVEGSAEGCNVGPLTAVLPAGTYIGFVSVFGSVGDVDCGTDYVLSLDATVAGACLLPVAGGEPVCELHLPIVCTALGGEYQGDASDCGGEPPCVLADANCDGAINGFDIDPFVLALTDLAGWQAQFPGCPECNVDVNCDGSINGFDIDPFVDCLTGGPCVCP